tara:strand:+ start:508 stop:1260 length:753 start_codon:yes stop_codon:yes gene_type:complete
MALAGKQFSDLAVTAAKRLKSSAVDRRLFVRHGIDYFGLFNGPTFNGRSWVNIAFFHGTKHTRHDPRIRPRNMRPGLPFNRTDLGLPIMKLRRGKVLDLNQIHFTWNPSEPREWPFHVSFETVMFCGESFTMTSELIKGTRTACVLKTARQLEKEAEVEKANMDWARIRRVKKGLESSDTIMAEVSKAPKAPKARMTAVSRISKARGRKFHLHFEGTAERNVDLSTFDGEKWRAVDWVYYVQPLVVPASV